MLQKRESKTKAQNKFFPKKITFDKGEKLDQKSIVQKFNQLFVNLRPNS